MKIFSREKFIEIESKTKNLNELYNLTWPIRCDGKEVILHEVSVGDWETYSIEDKWCIEKDKEYNLSLTAKQLKVLKTFLENNYDSAFIEEEWEYVLDALNKINILELEEGINCE